MIFCLHSLNLITLSVFSTIFWVFLIAFIFIAISYWNTYGKDKMPDYVKKNIKEEDERVNDEIQTIEETFTKELAEEKSPASTFFINAIRYNYRYLRLKELYVERENEFKGDEDALYFLDKNRKKIYEGSPTYTDFTNLCNEETLKIYGKLSEAYVEMKLNIPANIESKHNKDFSNEYFYYAKVGNYVIPQFASKIKKNTRLYIYPTTAVNFDKTGQLDIVSLQNVNIELKKVNDSKVPSCILSFDLIDFEIITLEVVAAEKFYNTFKELQKYENEIEWGLIQEGENTSKKEIEIQNILKKLDNLIGLEKVKKDFYNTADYLKIQQIRKLKGMKAIPSSYHYVFTGNPGTGKTTLARLLADIYREMGIVKTGQLIETDRSGLVAEYVGQTAVKTNKIIDDALGGVLFIDEAYSLVNGQSDDFGNEAISTLLKRMEDDRDKFIVIIAGYQNEMKKFLDSNPGLKSRFTHTLEFEDYSAEQLIEIYKRMISANDYKLSEEADSKLQDLMKEAVRTKQQNFGNARYVRNIFEKTLQNQATRLSREKNLSHQDLQTIIKEDIPA